MDTCIFLLLMERSDLRKKCDKLMVDSIVRSKLNLETVLRMVSDMVPIWEQHLQALQIFGKSLLMLGNTQPILLNWAREFFVRVFSEIPGSRVEVITSLLSSCNAMGSRERLFNQTSLI
jgi:hypothetical protein